MCQTRDVSVTRASLKMSGDFHVGIGLRISAKTVLAFSLSAGTGKSHTSDHTRDSTFCVVVNIWQITISSSPMVNRTAAASPLRGRHRRVRSPTWWQVTHPGDSASCGLRRSSRAGVPHTRPRPRPVPTDVTLAPTATAAPLPATAAARLTAGPPPRADGTGPSLSP